MSFGFPIQELDDSPKETFTADGAKIVRRFLIPWANRIQFAVNMTSVYTGYSAGPAPYAAFPFAVVESIENQPFSRKPDQFDMSDPISQVNSFAGTDACLTTVTYSTRKAQTAKPEDDDLPDGTYCSYEQQFGGEYLLVEGRSLEWEPGVPIGSDKRATVLVPITEHVVTWHKVTQPPWDAISKNKGKINSQDFKVPGQTYQFKAETLLFEGGKAATEYKIDVDQPQTWNLTYTFKERRINIMLADGATTVVGWNHLFRPEKDENARRIGSWQKPYVVGTNTVHPGQTGPAVPVYTYRSATNTALKQLFQFEVVA